MLAALSRELLVLSTPAGRRLRVDVVERRYIYDGAFADAAPDLFVTVEDLRWLVSDQIGVGHVFAERNFGRDGACHTPAGFFVLVGDGIKTSGPYTHATIYDIAPTVLSLAGLPVPEQMEGRPLGCEVPQATGDPESDAMSRLRALYLE